MKIGILGTGSVGQTIAEKLMELGHEVTIGTRNVADKLSTTVNDSRGNPPFSQWHNQNPGVKLETFANASAFGEFVINATNGHASLEALKMAGEITLADKILIDVSNPLDFSKGMPPSLIEGLNNTFSLGEEIQKNFPRTKVVKTFNTMWCGLMVNPNLIGNGNHLNFICGNDAEAKKKVTDFLKIFSWKEENIIDLGDISASRATESYLHLWLRLWGVMPHSPFNIALVKS